MNVTIYIKRDDAVGFVPLDLFKDEKIEINLNVKNLADISKIRSDFTQNFTIPCSPTNNKLFEYWYNAEVDGTFNANIRVDAYIEVNSIPFRFGSIQLDSCKLKKGFADSYSITFYGGGVNLSDKFGDDYLKDLDLSEFDHSYSSAVLNAINDSHINNGDIYYPLISAVSYFEYGTNSSKDIHKTSNDADYRDFKPALRELRIIEAIETKYGVTFSRDFLDRAIFYNKFLWLHKEQGRMRTSSTPLEIDYTSKNVTTADWGTGSNEINLTTNSVIIDWTANFPTSGFYQNAKHTFIYLRCFDSSGNDYKIEVFDNGVLYETHNNLYGNTTTIIYDKLYINDNVNHNFTFKVSALNGNVNINTQVYFESDYPAGGTFYYRKLNATSPSQTTANSILKISEQIPELKVKDYFNSLINEFNLILIPTSSTGYYIDTLDNWYSKGKAYDISNLVDYTDITINKPKVKKRIDFLYQKTDTILGKKYFENNQLSYGDLKATFNIQGDEMKIESSFENMLFERLYDVATSTNTDYHAGFSIDINLQPVKGKPISFYRNGIDTGDHIHLHPSLTYTSTWHTATEDNRILDQVTNSLNFGADNSTYLFSPIITGLYYNFWKTYIEDLYNKKTRVINLKCKLPIRILHNLGLNDRFILDDKKYKISSIKVDLTTADAELELFTDLSSPIDSYNDTILLTADTTNYSADTTLLTADRVSIHEPITSYTINGVSRTTYDASKGEENFELKISANTDWNLVTSDSWITSNKTNGVKSDYIRIKIDTNSGATRSGTIDVNIGSSTFTITITQV